MFLRRPKHDRRSGVINNQQGYMLLAVMLVATLMLIALSAETQRLGQQIRREHEEELIHRGKQYVRAIKLYYKKFGSYPNTLEQLEKVNNLRFLRQRYRDPITGEDDWRLIHVGEAKPIKIKTFGGPSGVTNPDGSPAGPGPGVRGGFTGGSGPGAGPGTTPPPPGVSGIGGGPEGENSGRPVDASSISKPAGGGKTFGGGPIVGVASTSKRESIKELNEKNHYNEWEFVYDPRFDINPAAMIGSPGIGPTGPGPRQGPVIIQ